MSVVLRPLLSLPYATAVPGVPIGCSRVTWGHDREQNELSTSNAPESNLQAAQVPDITYLVPGITQH